MNTDSWQQQNGRHIGHGEKSLPEEGMGFGPGARLCRVSFAADLYSLKARGLKSCLLSGSELEGRGLSLRSGWGQGLWVGRAPLCFQRVLQTLRDREALKSIRFFHLQKLGCLGNSLLCLLPYFFLLSTIGGRADPLGEKALHSHVMDPLQQWTCHQHVGVKGQKGHQKGLKHHCAYMRRGPAPPLGRLQLLHTQDPALCVPRQSEQWRLWCRAAEEQLS